MKLILIFILSLTFAHAGELIILTGVKDFGSIDLKKNHLEKIQQITKKKNVSLKLVTIEDKVPMDLKFLPAIYFQDHKGRSLFLGRYNNLQKIEKFIQTKKLLYSKPLKTKVEEAIVLEQGNFKLFVRLKVTDANGTLPKDFDQKTFKENISAKITNSFVKLKSIQEINQQTGDRTIYFDIYPWISEKSEVSLSTAIYSQFDCHTPISSSKTPQSSPLKQIDALLSSVANNFESKLFEILRSNTKGDAIDFNLNQTKVSWEKFGLILPSKPSGQVDIDPSKLITTKKWSYTKAKEDNKAPAVFFNFPAPLDHYAGQIRKSTSTLSLSDLKTFKDVKGVGIVDINSLDMGDNYLNESAVESIDSKDGRAKLEFFDLNFIDAKLTKLRFGEIFPIIGKGRLLMKGKSQDLDILGEAGLNINEQGKPRLFINMKFGVNINDAFNISGPDTSTPSNNIMNYNIIMQMEPIL